REREGRRETDRDRRGCARREPRADERREIEVNRGEQEHAADDGRGGGQNAEQRGRAPAANTAGGRLREPAKRCAEVHPGQRPESSSLPIRKPMPNAVSRLAIGRSSSSRPTSSSAAARLARARSLISSSASLLRAAPRSLIPRAIEATSRRSASRSPFSL